MSLTCQWKGPHGKPCLTALVERRNALGALAWACQTCARRVAGLCADCPSPVKGMVGRAQRCAVHVVARQRAYWTWYDGTRRPRKPDPMAYDAMGRLGGLKGGRARARSLSKERRQEIARMGGLAASANRRAAVAV